MLAARKIPAAAGLLAALFCGSEIVASAHVAIVAHAICAEHGEPIHAEAADGGEVVSPATPPSSDAVRAGRVRGGSDEHEHCKIAAGRTRSTPGTRAVVVPASIDAVAGADGTGAVVAPSVPLFRLAPKNSPPVIG